MRWLPTVVVILVFSLVLLACPCRPLDRSAASTQLPGPQDAAHSMQSMLLHTVWSFVERGSVLVVVESEASCRRHVGTTPNTRQFYPASRGSSSSGRATLLAEVPDPSLSRLTEGLLRQGRWQLLLRGHDGVLGAFPGLMRFRAAGYVLVGSAAEVTEWVGQLKTDFTWNNSARFVVGLRGGGRRQGSRRGCRQCARTVERSDFVAVARALMRSHVFSTVMFAAGDCGHRGRGSSPSPAPERLDVFSYLPFEDCRFGERLSQVTLVNSWDSRRNAFVRDGVDPGRFPPTVPRRWGGCPIVGSMSNYDDGYGSECQVMEDVVFAAARHIGCPMTMLRHAERDYSSEKKWHGSFQRLEDGLADVAIKFLWTTAVRYTTFDFTVSVTFERLPVFVTSGTASSRLPPLMPAAVEGLLVAMALVYTLLSGTSRLASPGHDTPDAEGSPRRSSGCAYTCLYIWALSNNLPASLHPTATWQRFFWASVALYTIPFNAMVRTINIADAAIPILTHHQTLADLDRARTSIGAVLQICDELRFLNESFPNLVRYRQNCSKNTSACVRSSFLQGKGRYAMIINKSSLRDLARGYTKNPYWELEAPLKIIPVVFYLPRGHPLLGEIDRVIGYLHNGGIIERWMENAVGERSFFSRKNVSKPKPLNFPDFLQLMSRFQKYVVAAVASFVCEVAFAFLRRGVSRNFDIVMILRMP